MKKIYVLLFLVITNYLAYSQFSIDNQYPFLGQEVHLGIFVGPGTVEWQFTPNTVTYVDGTHPQHRWPHVKFNDVGSYDVQLTFIPNGGGATQIYSEANYINVSDYPSFEITLSTDNEREYIEVSITPSINIYSPASNPVIIEHLQFGIMWDKTAVNGNKLDFDMVCDSDPISELYQIRQEEWPNPRPVPHNTHDGGADVENWDYRNFEMYDDPLNPPIKIPNSGWMQDEPYPIIALKVFRRTPGGNNAPEGDFFIIPPGDPANEWHDHAGTGYNAPYKWFKFSYNPVIELEPTPDFYSMEIVDGDPLNPILLDIPTALSGYYWHGGERDNQAGYDEHSWNLAENWRIGCGNSDVEATAPPGYLDDCVIPDPSIYFNKPNMTVYYPRNDNEDDPGNDPAECNNLYLYGGRLEWMEDVITSNDVNLTIWGNLEVGYSETPPGGYDDDTLTNSVYVYNNGHIEIGGDPDLIGNPEDYFADLKIYESGGVNIYAGGTMDANYDTHLNAETALVIHSDINGTGSFINTGSVTYGNNGNVKVETFITGDEDVYHMHFAGPTVKDVSYTNLTGVRLEQFNMTTLDTYAYEWRPDVDISIEEEHIYHGWENVWPFEYNVKVADGLAITNWEAGSGTMNMIGFLNADVVNPVEYEVYYAPPSSIDNQLELISNPFSAAIDFVSFYNYGSNSQYIHGHYWIWDEENGNYFGGVDGMTNGDIQVGQGFFVETKASGTLEFPASLREHSDVAFRELNVENLTLRMEVSGENSYKDLLTIYFSQNATNAYDPDLELKKWNSIREDATMIRSIAEDGTELAINALDEKTYYQDEVVSVPVHFQCGYVGTYTFDFSGIDSFDPGSEIWLEDKQIYQNNSAERSSMKITEDNHIYSFTGSPEDEHDRFIIHFNGPGYLPNAVDENSVAEKIKIYSSGNSVYILNNSNEEIKEMSVYNMLGQEILRSKVPIQELNKIDVNMTTGYYAVRVLTDKNVYSEKVFIKGY